MAHSAYLGGEDILCRVLGKYPFYAAIEDQGITPHLVLDGFWEIWITQALLRHIQPGMVCVDVGCNCGYYTVLLADAVGKEGHVLAIDPVKRHCELTRRNAEVNGLGDRVEVVEGAAWSEEGLSVPFLYQPSQGMNTKPCQNGSLSAPSYTVDSLTQAWPPVDFIKIDAEGSEPEVWEGMQAIIAKDPGLTVLLEFNPRRGYDGRDFLERIHKDFPLRYLDTEGRVLDLDVDKALNSDTDTMLWLSRN